MVDVCAECGVVFAGANLQRALSEVQEVASWLLPGDYGELRGSSMHRWSGEISGRDCQHIAVLRLLTQAEVTEVIAWGTPEDVLKSNNDDGLIVISDMNTGFWAFRMDGFLGWNGESWGMPDISSAQKWDKGPGGVRGRARARVPPKLSSLSLTDSGLPPMKLYSCMSSSFEGVCLTPVILTSGARGREGLSSTC